MLPPPRAPRQGSIDVALVVGLAKLDEAETLDQAWQDLSSGEKAAVLGDARGLDRLRTLHAARTIG